MAKAWRATGIRRPALIFSYPFLLFLLAAAGARATPWLNHLFSPSTSFTYTAEVPLLPADQALADRLKQQMLDSDDPGLVLLYCTVAGEERRRNNPVRFTLSADEARRLDRWANDPDTRVQVAVRSVQSGNFGRADAAGRLINPAQALPGSREEALDTVFTGLRQRLHDPQLAAARKLELLDELCRQGDGMTAENMINSDADTELLRAYCRRGPFPEPQRGADLSYSEPLQHYQETVVSALRRGQLTGILLRECLDRGLIWNYPLLVNSLQERHDEAGPVPVEQVLDLVRARDPLLCLIGLQRLRELEAYGGAEEDAVLPPGPAVAADPAVGMCRAALAERLSRNSCYFLQLLASLPQAKLRRWSWQPGHGFTEPVMAQAEDPELLAVSPREPELITALARAGLDERAPQVAVPDRAVLRRLQEQSREIVQANPARFEPVWAAVKLAVLADSDVESARMLYALEPASANRARIVEFAFKLSPGPLASRLLAGLMAASELFDPGQQRALFAVWERCPTPERIALLMQGAVAAREAPDAQTLAMFQRWLGRTSLPARLRLRLFQDYSKLSANNYFVFCLGLALPFDGILAQVPVEEQADTLREFYAECREPLWQLWAADRLNRRGVPTGLDLARRYAGDAGRPALAAMALRALHSGLPADEFPLPLLRSLCYYDPATGAALLESGCFDDAPGAGVHDLLEQMAEELAPWHTTAFQPLRAALVRTMERIGGRHDEYWGITPRALPGTPAVLPDWMTEQRIVADRDDFKAIETAEDGEAFWALYDRVPEALWSMKPEGTGPRLLLRFLNDPRCTRDRDKYLDEITTYSSSPVWQKTVTAERLAGDGGVDDISDFPVAHVGWLAVAPTLDGEIVPAEWEQAARLEAGARDVVGDPLTTGVLLGYTADGLYLAWSAGDRRERVESQPFDPQTPFHKRESFSFFFDVMRLYRKLAVFNADSRGNGALATWESAPSGGELQRTVTIGWHDGCWQGETFLAWTELRAVCPEPGAVWRFTFRRNQLDGTRTNVYQWTEMPKNPYQPEYYGFLVFE